MGEWGKFRGFWKLRRPVIAVVQAWPHVPAPRFLGNQFDLNYFRRAFFFARPAAFAGPFFLADFFAVPAGRFLVDREVALLVEDLFRPPPKMFSQLSAYFLVVPMRVVLMGGSAPEMNG